MKNIRAPFPALLFIAFALATACSKQEPSKESDAQATPAPDRPLGKPIEGFDAYRFPRFPVRVQYPASWERREDKIGVTFVLPGTSVKEGVIEGVTILVDEMYGDLMSFEEYKKRIIADLKIRTVDFNLIESDETTLGGEPAYRLSYSGLFDDVPMRYTSIYCITHGLLSVASFSAASSRYDEYTAEVEKIFGSFEFL
jgi:hypothetical protein